MAFVIKRAKPEKKFNMNYWSSTFQWGEGWVQNPILATKYFSREEAEKVTLVIQSQRKIRTVVIQMPGPLPEPKA